MAASAFPTHSPSASTIRKSFFDASAIGTISGNAIVAVYPITEVIRFYENEFLFFISTAERQG